MLAKRITIGLLGGTGVAITFLLITEILQPQTLASVKRVENTAVSAETITYRETVMNETTSEFEETARETLTAEQYNVCFLKGTEPPGSGEYYQHFDPGTYHCAVCSEALFKSDTKYDSGSGWPAFFAAINTDAVASHSDDSMGMRRVEITCANCNSHLGHVFDDGPAPTGQRYCVNSLSLEFVADDDDTPAAVR